MVDDLVVVVPGVTGSALADADGKQVWGLGPGGITRALATFGGSIRSLALPPDIGDGPAPDGVTATGLIAGFHVIPGIWSPVEGYGRLEKFLLSPRFGLVLDRPEVDDGPAGNLICFAYDWRLSNRHTAMLLKGRVETALERWRASASERADARVVFICHSMGGLIARWYVERDGGAEITRSLVTLGTPHRGSLKALTQLVNGVRKGVGFLKTDLTDFGRSLPSSYQLLPEYACIEDGALGLRRTTEVTLPQLDTAMVRDGMRFHEQLDEGPSPDYQMIPIVGIGQQTQTTARPDGDRFEPLDTYEDEDEAGDGTVPRLAARPNGMTETHGSIRGVGQGHGALAVHRAVRDQLEFILTASGRVHRGIAPTRILDVTVDDLHVAGERVDVTVRAPERRVLEVSAVDESGGASARALVDFRRGERDGAGRAVGVAVLAGLKPGGHTIVVAAPDDPHANEVEPVHHTTLVLRAE